MFRLFRFANAAHFVQGWKSWWLPFRKRSRKKPAWIFSLPPRAEYPLFTIPSESFFCMIKWTFVRINYHYMGLPFLCMRGSLRITGRLLHIFFQTHCTRSAFIFSILQFLGRRWVFADPKLCQRLHSRKVCACAYFSPAITDTEGSSFFFVYKKKQHTLGVRKFPQDWPAAACSLCPYVSYNTQLTFSVRYIGWV